MPALVPLRRRADFDAVMRGGSARSHRLIVLRWLRTGRPEMRVGFSTPRTIGGAVVRNRVRRRLREIMRERRDRIGGGIDLLLIVRPESAAVGYGELRAAVATLLQRSGIETGT